MNRETTADAHGIAGSASGASAPERIAQPAGVSRGGRLDAALHSAWVVAASYLVATLVLTWPLLPGILHDLPADLGDPLLNCWILDWDARHLLQFLSGDPAALRGFWQGNIFYPAPLTLAYSEHLVPQAITILPVYALTQNLVLCYNLLFLSTFVLSGLGVYLLARSLTGNASAAFVAGLLFAFAPYRLAQFPHVQVLSTQWMPFTLYGLHCFFVTRRWRALAGAAAALLLQNLSCGYFLLFFAPFAAAFAAWELVRRGLARDWRLLVQLAGAGAAVALGTWPFLIPYLELRTLGYSSRSLQEVNVYSANVLGYLTGVDWIHGWGRLFDLFRRPEGEVFPGFVASVLALTATVLAVRGAWSAASRPGAPPHPPWRRHLIRLAGAWTVAQWLVVLYLLAGGDQVVTVGRIAVRMKDFSRPLLAAFGSLAVYAAAEPRSRTALRHLLDREGFWIVAAVAATVLSWGPVVRTGVKTLGTGPYLLLYRYVPGFDGLRVPARFGLLVALMVSVLAAFALARWLGARRRGALTMAVLVALFVSEILPIPIRVNGTGGTERLQAPGPVQQGAAVPAVYRYLRELPGREPILEFPFGDPAYELQYVYYTTEHRHPIVNGYSGVFPPRYMRLREVFGYGREWEQPWEVVPRSGARLVVVHEGAYVRPVEGERVSAWLQAQGAHPVAAFDGDKVFRLP